MDDIGELLQAVTDRESPSSHRAGCISALRAAGFSVLQGFRVANRGDGHAGRVDLAAFGHGIEIGIVLDRATPRRKSAEKLLCREWRRYIVLYEWGGWRREFQGVTVVYPPEFPGAPGQPA